MSDRITLRGMQFMGRHGVADEEREAPQLFEVDLVVRLDLSKPATTDDLSDTVDYARTRLMSFCTSPIVPAINAVTAPMTATMIMVSGAWLKRTAFRPIMYTPAVTILAA